MEKNKKNETPGTLRQKQNFSDLPHDMVLLISSKLSSSYFDMLSLKETCSSWKIAMRNCTTTTYPMLVSLDENYEFSLFGMNDERRYKFKKSPWLVEQYKSHEEFKNFVEQYRIHYQFQKLPRLVDDHCRLYRVLGSHPDGWVVILSNPTKMVYLLHLFMEIKIELPNIATKRTRLVPMKIIVSSNDKNGDENLIVVMSMSYCYGLEDTKLAMWRQGDSNWTCFGGNFRVLDIAFCKNTIYAIRGCDRGRRYLESWDLNKCLPEKKLSIQLFGNHAFVEHLVVSSLDEIFIWDFRTWHSCIKGFIYKLDLSKEECVSVASLNGRSLFFGFGESVFVSDVDVEKLGLKANCVYFAEKDEEDIKLRIYDFDFSGCDKPEFQDWPPDMQPFGLFLLST